MRAVSFVDRLELDFIGSVYKYAVTLGDVDNDGGNELIVGNSAGDLAIFKGRNSKPWLKGHDLGLITGIGVGDLLNIGRNVLTVVSGDGWCHVFDVESGFRDCSDNQRGYLHPIHTQRIPANTKVLLLDDVNNDGKIELVIALTDRVIRTYQWRLVAKDKAGFEGKLVGIHKWEFANQIGTISVNCEPDGKKSILVGHSGGTFLRIKCQKDEEQPSGREVLFKIHLSYFPLASARMRNPNVSTEIVGNVMPATEGKGTPYALATLDGTLQLVQNEQILWSFQVDHQLSSLAKLDITGDGKDEIIACAWDGQTYIVNQEKETVRFQFEESVSTFCVGTYSLSPGKMDPSLVYVTFNDKIFVYYNIRLNKILTTSLTKLATANLEVERMLKDHSFDSMDEIRKKEFYKWCLYGLKSKNSLKAYS